MWPGCAEQGEEYEGYLKQLCFAVVKVGRIRDKDATCTAELRYIYSKSMEVAFL
jgi:hypothetical protein